MALPKTDAFTHADTPLTTYDAGWVNHNAGAGGVFGVASNTAQPTVSGVDCLYYWATDTPGNDQYAQTVVASVNGTTTYMGPVIRMQTGTPGTGYSVESANGDRGVYVDLSAIAASLDSGALANSDLQYISASGTTITYKINGSTIYSGTRSDHASGSFGIYGYESPGFQSRQDSFEGGNLAAAGMTSTIAASFTKMGAALSVTLTAPPPDPGARKPFAPQLTGPRAFRPQQQGTLLETSGIAASFTHMGVVLAAKQTHASTIAASFTHMGAALVGTQKHTGTQAMTFTKMAAALVATQKHTGTVASSFIPMAAALNVTHTAVGGNPTPDPGARKAFAPQLAGPRAFRPTPPGVSPVPPTTTAMAMAFTHMGAALTAKQTHATTVAASFIPMAAALNVTQRQTGTVASSFIHLAAALVVTQKQTGTLSSSFTHMAIALLATEAPKGAVAAAFIHLAIVFAAHATILNNPFDILPGPAGNSRASDVGPGGSVRSQ